MSALSKLAKKTMRTRATNSESNTGTKPTKKQTTEVEKLSKNTRRTRGGMTKRKRAENRKRDVSKSVSRESVAISVSRESLQPSKSQIVRSEYKSIDLEEDPEPPTPDSTSTTKKEEKDDKEDREKDKEKVKKVEDKEEKEKPKKVEEKEEKPPKKVEEEKEKPKKIWTGMEVAMKFWANSNDIAKMRQEYNFLESMVCNKTTKAFDANTERNREFAPKIYDENRVVLDRPGHEEVNYINASFISVKDFTYKLIVAQLPRMENESFVEDFWQMIYQEQITLVYLLVPNSILAKAPTKLFTEEHDSFQYVGKMFINNRRARPGDDPKEYTIEVLPQGNSDSVMCQVHHYSGWQHLQQPPKTSQIIRMIHQFHTEKEIQSASVCVVSEWGSGRACSFIVALIAINQLNKGVEPNIMEIMTNIKQQRPGATESFAQYVGIYAVILDYITRKCGLKNDPTNKAIKTFIQSLAAISPPQSPVIKTSSSKVML